MPGFEEELAANVILGLVERLIFASLENPALTDAQKLRLQELAADVQVVKLKVQAAVPSDPEAAKS